MSCPRRGRSPTVAARGWYGMGECWSGAFLLSRGTCGKTFTALTGTPLARLRFKSTWMAYQACMRTRMTLHQSAAACGISYRTAFLWRHRFLANARTPTALEGIVEMDETYVLESCKGSRSLRQRRKRGGGRGVPRGRSQAHRPALTAVARGGATYAQQAPDTTATMLQENIATWTTSDRQ